MVVLFAGLLSIMPIYGLLWLGIRNERIRNERLLKDSLRALRLVRIARGDRNV